MSRPVPTALLDAWVVTAYLGALVVSALPRAVIESGWPALAAFTLVAVTRRLWKAGALTAAALAGLVAAGVAEGTWLRLGADWPHLLDLLVLAVVTQPLLHRSSLLGRLCGAGAVLAGAAVGATVSGPLREPAHALSVGAAPLVLTALLATPSPERRSSLQRAAGLAGALLGAAGTGLTALHHPWSRALPQALGMRDSFVTLALEAAPAVLLALVLSAAFQVFSLERARRWLGRGGPVSQALRGTLVAAPLPICSCGVVPLYHGLIGKGVPPVAALAFLIAAPEIGVDAMLLSVPLLGWPMAIVRLLAAGIIAVLVAVAVGRLIPRREVLVLSVPTAGPRLDRATLRRGLDGIAHTLDHTGPWIVLGLVGGAVLEPLLDPATLGQLPRWLAPPVAAALGIPAYVCASAATPLVAVLMHKGLSGGAALAFLLTGPATNATTFGVLSSLHGRRIALGFGAAVFASATVLGWGVDLLSLGGAGMALHARAHDSPGPLHLACAAVLALASVGSLYRQGPRGVLGQLLGQPAAAPSPAQRPLVLAPRARPRLVPRPGP